MSHSRSRGAPANFRVRRVNSRTKLSKNKATKRFRELKKPNLVDRLWIFQRTLLGRTVDSQSGQC
jgi:hypothetical protein